MRRILSLWLPFWPTERLARAGFRPEGPLALIQSQQGGQRLVSVDRAAADEGLTPGMLLTDARALVPHLKSLSADPAADAEALVKLAQWLTRYTPWVGLDGNDGLTLDVSGVAHLFGGEAALIADLVDRLGALGITGRTALAPSAAAAAALARFGPSRCRIENDGAALRRAVDPLPVSALRFNPALTENWRHLGLLTIGQLRRLPRAALARRYGANLLDRLDEIYARNAPPLAPLQPLSDYHVRLAFAEPISESAAIVTALTRLSRALAEMLARDHKGARKLAARLYRVDGAVQNLIVGLARASREADHLMHLFAEKLEQAHCDSDAGFGYDAIALTAIKVEDLAPIEAELKPAAPRGGLKFQGVDDLGSLVDRLGNRLGLERIGQMVPRESHIPETAFMFRSVAKNGFAQDHANYDWRVSERQERPRPLRLFGAPEPIEVVAEVPDGPPARFRWRRAWHEVVAAEGPERIEAPWWNEEESGGRVRDYFRVEDKAGLRFWLFRAGLYRDTAMPRWFLHGLYA